MHGYRNSRYEMLSKAMMQTRLVSQKSTDVVLKMSMLVVDGKGVSRRMTLTDRPRAAPMMSDDTNLQKDVR